MAALDRSIPAPPLVKFDDVDLAAGPRRVWDAVRHGDLAQSALMHALFTLRTLNPPKRPARSMIGSPPPGRPTRGGT